MTLERAVLWLSGAVFSALAFEIWRSRRVLAARGGQGYPIVTTTGIRS